MTAPVKRYMHISSLCEAIPALMVIYPGADQYVMASDYDRLEQECAELRKKLNSAIGQAARRNIYISIAEALLSDPDYELSGTDYDYEHPLHDKIKAIKTERDTLRAQVEAMQADKAAIDLLNQYIVTAADPDTGKTVILADSGTLRDCMEAALQNKPCQHLPIGWLGDAIYCELCGEKV